MFTYFCFVVFSLIKAIDLMLEIKEGHGNIHCVYYKNESSLVARIMTGKQLKGVDIKKRHD